MTQWEMQWLTWVLGRLSLVLKCADGDVAARYTDKTLNDTNPNNTTPNDTTTKYLTMKSPKNRTKCLMWDVLAQWEVCCLNGKFGEKIRTLWSIFVLRGGSKEKQGPISTILYSVQCTVYSVQYGGIRTIRYNLHLNYVIVQMLTFSDTFVKAVCKRLHILNCLEILAKKTWNFNSFWLILLKLMSCNFQGIYTFKERMKIRDNRCWLVENWGQ